MTPAGEASARSPLAPAAGDTYHSTSGAARDASPLPEEDPLAKGGAPRDCCAAVSAYCRGELQLAWDGSVEVMLECVEHLGLSFSEGLPRKELESHPLLRYNPAWWAGVAGCAAFLVLGHVLHTALGQGGPVREDEQEIERSARVGWVYVYSGGFVLTNAMDAVDIALSAARHEFGHGFRASLVSFAIGSWYLFGDWHLLYRMSRKDAVMVHSCVVSRVTFGVALLFVFVFAWLFHKPPDNYAADFPQWTMVSWFLRLSFCLFMVLAALGYSPLLHIMYDDGGGAAAADDKRPSPWSTARGATLWLLAILGPVALLGLSTVFMVVGQRPLLVVPLVPLSVLAGAFLVEGTQLNCRTLYAVFNALLPCLVVTSGFMVAGPYLWSCLAGE